MSYHVSSNWKTPRFSVFFFPGDDGLEKKNDFLYFVTDTE